MAPAGQGSLWSEVLCCPICSKLFDCKRIPINLSCGHAVCRSCLLVVSTSACPLDQTCITLPVNSLPCNAPLMAIIGIIDSDTSFHSENLDEYFYRCEKVLVQMSTHLRKTESERGGIVWSGELSRPVQRKLLSLLCFQLLEDEGRLKAVKTARALCERILTELVVSHQNTVYLSSNLWSAVRSRGCQFLGPAMQEEVLRLILLTLSEGALIARKTLVMYIVQTLGEDYPQVSKTCVGHVVQLLYRASCFNVMKREGKSSLMQLKTEFRDYESLRREHDTQIVQVAMEAGLRISPDQWSSLLYGDQAHRSHMQSIIDKLQSPQAYGQLIQELSAALERSSDPDSTISLIRDFEYVGTVDPSASDVLPWEEVAGILDATARIIDTHVRFMRRKNEQKSVGCGAVARRICASSKAVMPTDKSSDRRFKTRLCRDISQGRSCPRGSKCTYAHSSDELRHNSCEAQSSSSLSAHVPPILLTRPRTRVTNHGASQPLSTISAAIEAHQTPTIVLDAIKNDRNHLGRNCLISTEKLMQIPLPIVPLFAGDISSSSNETTLLVTPTMSFPTEEISAGSLNGVTKSAPPPSGHVMMMTPRNVLPSQIPPLIIPPPMWPPPPPHQIPVESKANMPVQQATPPPPLIPIHFQQSSAQMTFAPNRHVLPASNGFPYTPYCEWPERCWRYSDDIYSDGSRFLTANNLSTIHLESVKRDVASKSSEYDEEQLMLRRQEIVSRLAALNQPFTSCINAEESIDEEDLKCHVSFTVANSVLYDDKDAPSSGHIQFPPLSFALPSFSEAKHDRTKPATVQAPCTEMHVKDSINQPLPTPAIQRSHQPLMPMHKMMDPTSFIDCLPSVIKPLPIVSCDPQNVVRATLDRIVDVRERLNDADRNGGLGSTVEKQQLKVELSIVNRQIQSLDQGTKQSCLLRELEAVDKKIEHLNIHS